MWTAHRGACHLRRRPCLLAAEGQQGNGTLCQALKSRRRPGSGWWPLRKRAVFFVLLGGNETSHIKHPSSSAGMAQRDVWKGVDVEGTPVKRDSISVFTAQPECLNLR